MSRVDVTHEPKIVFWSWMMSREGSNPHLTHNIGEEHSRNVQDFSESPQIGTLPLGQTFLGDAFQDDILDAMCLAE